MSGSGGLTLVGHLPDVVFQVADAALAILLLDLGLGVTAVAAGKLGVHRAVLADGVGLIQLIARIAAPHDHRLAADIALRGKVGELAVDADLGAGVPAVQTRSGPAGSSRA